MTAASDVIEGGLHAWMAGDLDAIERLLHPNATLHAVEPGPWDCTDRAQIMAVLRQRQAEQPNQPPRPVRITRLDDATYLVASNDASPEHGEPFPTTTRININNGKVTAMQQYRTDDLTAAHPSI